MECRSRRQFLRSSLALTAVGLLVGCDLLPGAPSAPITPKVRRIGVLGAILPGPFGELFRQALLDRGYVEGQNILIEWRSDEGRAERLAENVAALVKLNVELIVANGTERAVAAKQATSTIPLVMTSGTDPIGAGLVESFARPGGNVTGHIESHPQLASRQLELLREIAPGISHVSVLEWGSVGDRRHEELEVAARTLGLQLRVLRTPTVDVLDDRLAQETGQRVDALVVLHSGFMTAQQAKIFAFAARQRVPVMYGRRTYVEAGGLAAYGPNLEDLYHGAAAYVDKILKGAKPAELPVELPTKFDFVINLQAARALGLTVPPGVLQQVTKIVE